MTEEIKTLEFEEFPEIEYVEMKHNIQEIKNH